MNYNNNEVKVLLQMIRDMQQKGGGGGVLSK